MWIKECAINSSIEAIAFTDLKYDITYANRSFVELMGASNESDLRGKRANDIIVGAREEDHPAIANSRDKGSWSGELILKTLDGRQVPVQSMFNKVCDPLGKVICFMFSCIDISSLKRAEKEREQYLAQLHHASKLVSIGTLAAGVAHEINNPLSILLGTISFLRDRIKSTSMDQNLLNVLTKQDKTVDRIAKIVKGLGTFARVDTEKTGKIDINKIVLDTLSLCEAIYVKAGLEIRTDFRCKNPQALGNTGKFQQVIMNLLSNAKDATEDMTAKGVVTIETFEDSKNIFLRVSDNGRGIEKANLPYIFDPFFTTKPQGKGTGLGLSISYGIIKNFGGSISVESEPGMGTVFTISMLKTHHQLAASDEKSNEPLEGKLAGKVLVVDDETDIREILKNYLEDFGLVVTLADDGDSALQILKKENFDVVITDIRMPNFTGDALLAEARRLPHLGKTFFLAMISGVVTDYPKEQRDRINNLTHGYLRKPFDKRETKKVFVKLLGQNPTC